MSVTKPPNEGAPGQQPRVYEGEVKAKMRELRDAKIIIFNNEAEPSLNDPRLSLSAVAYAHWVWGNRHDIDPNLKPGLVAQPAELFNSGQEAAEGTVYNLMEAVMTTEGGRELLDTMIAQRKRQFIEGTLPTLDNVPTDATLDEPLVRQLYKRTGFPQDVEDILSKMMYLPLSRPSPSGPDKTSMQWLASREAVGRVIHAIMNTGGGNELLNKVVAQWDTGKPGLPPIK